MNMVRSYKMQNKIAGVINVILFITKWTMVLLFTYTAISKWKGYQNFLHDLTKVPVVHFLANFMSVAIPTLEIIATICLIVEKWEIVGWWICAILMTMFSIYVGGMLCFSPNLPCSCGGIINALSWQQHFYINISLAVLCWIKLYLYYFKEIMHMGSKLKTQ